MVTELPYLIGPERVIEQIKTLVNARRLQGIADVRICPTGPAAPGW